jgi:hypothetical protein
LQSTLKAKGVTATVAEVPAMTVGTLHETDSDFLPTAIVQPVVTAGVSGVTTVRVLIGVDTVVPAPISTSGTHRVTDRANGVTMIVQAVVTAGVLQLTDKAFGETTTIAPVPYVTAGV